MLWKLCWFCCNLADEKSHIKGSQLVAAMGSDFRHFNVPSSYRFLPVALWGRWSKAFCSHFEGGKTETREDSVSYSGFHGHGAQRQDQSRGCWLSAVFYLLHYEASPCSPSFCSFQKNSSERSASFLSRTKLSVHILLGCEDKLLYLSGVWGLSSSYLWMFVEAWWHWDVVSGYTTWSGITSYFSGASPFLKCTRK